jgi:hypothetical protein
MRLYILKNFLMAHNKLKCVCVCMHTKFNRASMYESTTGMQLWGNGATRTMAQSSFQLESKKSSYYYCCCCYHHNIVTVVVVIIVVVVRHIHKIAKSDYHLYHVYLYLSVCPFACIRVPLTIRIFMKLGILLKSVDTFQLFLKSSSVPPAAH